MVEVQVTGMIGGESAARRPLHSVLKSADLLSADPGVQERIEKLKIWRRSKASLQGVAAYRVLSNRTLLAVASAGPRSGEELLRVRGIGPKKLAAYGAEILAITTTA